MFEEVMPGGGFLVAEVPLGKLFTREDFDETQKEFADTIRKFVVNEVLAKVDAIEEKATEGGKPLVLGLLKQSADIGMCSVEIPEAYGGLGMDKVASAIVAEALAGSPSFAVTSGAHAGIGMLPIVFFGNEEQKQKWLPKLSAVELLSCYALTEPTAGSDALSGRTTATPIDNGKAFKINGEKQFITNGGWADIAIVFAQLEGKYTGFIVDLHQQGVSRGAEEKKMGIKGSSTTSLSFEDVVVPAENMLGKPGMAAQIALNILNLGRMKLGLCALGNCKYAIDLATAYATERKQFGQPILSFDMQKGHLAEMVADTFAIDSLCYRAVGDIDRTLAKLPKDDTYAAKTIDTLRAYALECSIIKVGGAETLTSVIGKAVRMHGGYGFIHDYKVEMIARDNVVDNIYEGTNDINRLTIFDTLARNILGAGLPFRQFMEAVEAELREGRVKRQVGSGPLAEEMADCRAAKRAVAYAVNHAIIHCGKDIKNEQQVMEAVANATIALYKMDSTVARVAKIHEHHKGSAAHRAIAALVCHNGREEIESKTREILCAVVPEPQLATKLSRLEALHGALGRPFNVVQAKRTIADAVIEAGGYRF
jgi:alkylation response protein AidB-like acyl-CoA dehydrogenase